MFRGQLRWVWKLLAFALGLALVAGAVVAALSHVDLHQARTASPWLAAALGALVLGNLFLTAAIFWAITRSFDAQPPVGLARMWDLACSSTLLNYLPLLRAGLVGRTAYLRLRHALPVHQALIIAALVFLLFMIAAVGAAAVALGLPGLWAPPVGAAALIVVSWATSRVAQTILHRPLHRAWLWMPLRTLDVLCVAGRFWAAFRILGHPITFRQAIVFGAADMVVSVIPLTSNGLGLSEWVTGFLAGLLGMPLSIGNAAKLVDRSLSIIVLIPAALWSLHRLRRTVAPLPLPPPIP